ncbi:MAG: phosphate acyltransferase [Pseudomonadota bacterium]
MIAQGRCPLGIQIVRKHNPELIIDGEMQADTAVSEEILNRLYPFNRLGSPANVLIFPNPDAGNSAYELLNQLGGTIFNGDQQTV